MADTRWVWVEVGCTVVAPTVLLMFGTGWLGPTGALFAALAFPFGFAIASMVREGRPSGLAVVSITSVALTGALGLLELDPGWFALKEAAVPAALGLAMAASAATRFAVVPIVLERILDRERTQAALERTGGRAAYERVTRLGTVAMGAVFVGSGVANFVLARLLVTAPTGTEAFTRELGSYTMWSFPAITVPVLIGTAFVLQWVLRGLEAAVGGSLEELLVA